MGLFVKYADTVCTKCCDASASADDSAGAGAPDNDKTPHKRKLADMIGVRAYGNEPQVELWLNENHRLVVVAYNEAGYCATEVDLWDILDWAQTGSGHGMVLDNGSNATRAKLGHSRN